MKNNIVKHLISVCLIVAVLNLGDDLYVKSTSWSGEPLCMTYCGELSNKAIITKWHVNIPTTFYIPENTTITDRSWTFKVLKVDEKKVTIDYMELHGRTKN